MRKRNPIIRWKSRTGATAPPTAATPAMQRYASFAASLRQLVVDWGLIGLLLVGSGLLISEVLRPEVVLDPIEVPEDIAKLGYSGVVVAEQFADAATDIELETQELSSQNSWHKEAENLRGIGTLSHTPDITVPGAAMSMRSFARFIRQELGLHSIYLHGEIVHEPNGLVLSLRNLSTANIPAERVAISGNSIAGLFPAGGRALLKLSTPAALAMHQYHQFNTHLESPTRDSSYAEAMQLFEYCLKFPPTTDDALVLYLWGSAFQDLKRPYEAIGQFQKAIQTDPNFSYAYNGWGNALLNLNRAEEAIVKYRKAIELDPKYVNAYINGGNALHRVLKRPEEAIAQFKKAIGLDPKNADAYNNWGKALKDLKRPIEAIEQFKKAIELDPKNADAYNNWGEALADRNRPNEAIEQYRNATALDPKFAKAYFNWGNALSDLKRPEEEAKAQYRKATEPTQKMTIGGMHTQISSVPMKQ